MKSKYIIGIDLGTTNCTLAYCENEQIEQFSIPQMIAEGTEGKSELLPSFIYFPLSEEIESKLFQISWDLNRILAVGAYAKTRGAELPERLVASAKSWACHSGIDRRKKILPYKAETCELSPLEALAEILKHLREGWDVTHPKDVLHDQKVFITVPASFDPSARQLVEEAAQLAGYPEVVLLEEPQAAFYAWLDTHKDTWRKILKVGDTILVADIGGGTTDFTLIGVSEEQGDLTLSRKAVGAHLLLGGDNLDLALGYFVKQKLEDKGHAIDDWQFQSLIHSCRKAKETLLNENAPAKIEIVIPGRGSRLIGNALKTSLTQEEAINLLVEGFLPIITPEQCSKAEKHMGIQEVGLPFAKDPRISSQLAKFLSMSGESDNFSLENFILPTTVLFNGGTLKSDALRQRLLDLLNHFAKLLDKPLIKELPGADLDFAVSRGAVAYGLAREGRAIRIRGGTSRSYYVGIEDAVPAVPGIARPLKAFCVVPFGMEEGTEQELSTQEFSLLLGELATFRFFSHATPNLSNGVKANVGTLIKNWKGELTELHPLEVLLPQEKVETVKVRLKSKITELGVLELWCVTEDDRKWKLEFDIRQQGETCQV